MFQNVKFSAETEILKSPTKNALFGGFGKWI